jgi:PAS domain-containing protein
MSNTYRDSEADRVSLALSAAEMGTWNLDVSAGVIWWDDRMHSLFGVAPGAFSRNYEDFLALLHDEDRERIRDEFDRAAAACTAMDTQFRVIWPSDGASM